jgi:hypothetical protein
MNGLKCLLYIICLLSITVVTDCVVVSGEPVAVEAEEIEMGFPPPPPPPMVVVTRPARPSRFHIWIEGHHVVRSGEWVWVGGHWARPARRGMKWVPGYTRRVERGWIWRPGHWH